LGWFLKKMRSKNKSINHLHKYVELYYTRKQRNNCF